MEDEYDTITIELGKTLTDEQYDEVLASVIAFMEMRWPDFAANRFTN